MSRPYDLRAEVAEYEKLDAYGKRDFPKDRLVRLFSNLIGSDITWSLQIAPPLESEAGYSGLDYS